MPEQKERVLTQEDQEYLKYLLSPDWIIPRAKEYGLHEAFKVSSNHARLIWDIDEDSRFLAVLGAEDAAWDVRRLIKKYAEFVRWRDKKSARDLKLAQSLRAAGWLSNFQSVRPLRDVTSWREVAACFWPRGEGQITCDVEIPVEGYSQKWVDLAVVKALSEALVRFPNLNRALLQGKIWQRSSGHVMLHLEPKREQIRSIIISAERFSLQRLRERLSNATKAIIRAEKHELNNFTDDLLKKWSKTGFIASPAGIMISLVGSKNLLKGHAALLTDVNGIGMCVVVGRIEDNKVRLKLDTDHRMFDAEQEGILFTYVERRVPELLREEAK